MRFFQLFLKHADVISRVNAWGVTDGDSWKNDFPVRGRKEYPLFFDRQYQPKPFIQELLSNPTK
jgi:endo-1,4-beta-xylanase